MWSGKKPDARLGERMQAEGIVFAAGGDCVAEVVAADAAGTAARGGRAGRPWLWLATAGATPEQVTAAVVRGAYDVIDGRDPPAAALLARRLRELACTDVEVPASDKFIGESEA